MPKSILKLSVLIGLVVVLAAGQLPPAIAAGEVTFTVTVRSAFLRAQPAVIAEPIRSVFQGQSYRIVGRTPDSAWLQLSFAGGWILASFGQVTGALDGVPVVIASAPPAATPSPAAAVSGGQPAAVVAAGPVQYTVAVKSLFGRSTPSLSGQKVISLFKGQAYAATARSADGSWLRLALNGGGTAWVPIAAGSLAGDPAGLPLGGSAAPVSTAPPPPPGPVLPVVSQAARDIYQRGLEQGNNPRAFSKIGDCNSVTPFFLAAFDKGEYRLGPTYAYLQAVIDNFAGSFGRDGMASRDGLNTASMFDPNWANPQLCERGETPLACEVRLNNPSVAIVSLGTNGGWQTNEEYETYMRRLLDFLIEGGVLPILSTKADNLEGGDRFNRIVVRLAGEYQLPLWDFALAARGLPNGGLADSYHLTYGQAFYDTAAAPQRGWALRNLTALQALDTVLRGVQQP